VLSSADDTWIVLIVGRLLEVVFVELHTHAVHQREVQLVNVLYAVALELSDLERVRFHEVLVKMYSQVVLVQVNMPFFLLVSKIEHVDGHLKVYTLLLECD